MISLLFGWVVKPRLFLSFLDYAAMLLEILVIGLFAGYAGVVIKSKKRAKIRKRHGPNCTCLACLGFDK